MKALAFCLLFLGLRAQAQPAFRGYAGIEQILTERLLADGDDFTFSRYLKTNSSSDDAKPLLDLLGTYDKEGGADKIKNGDPNSVNMLLWQVLLQLTGQDLAARCQHQGSLRLNPVFQAALEPLCKWPAPEAKSDEALRAFWTGIMGYDAPEEDFLAWERFVLRSSYASQPAAQALPVLFFLATYDPHFLLRD